MLHAVVDQLENLAHCKDTVYWGPAVNVILYCGGPLG